MSDQPKVFEFAKEVGLETIALMDKIREWKLPVKSHMASLDLKTIDEIKKRLDEESQKSGSGKKKTKAKAKAKKTVAKKATTKKKTVAKKKAVKKKTAKVVTKATSTGVAKKTTKKKATTSRKVIRRKAADIQEAEDAAKESALLQAQAEPSGVSQSASAEPSGDSLSETPTQQLKSSTDKGLAKAVSEAEEGSTQSAAPEAQGPRGKIVGRMDLGRLSKSQGGSGQSVRESRTAPTRNIRTGFVAPQMPFEQPNLTDEFQREQKRKEDKKKKAAGSGGLQKDQPQQFTATEFRKREVIFQPKKKRVAGVRESKRTQITTPKASKRVVKVYGVISLSELAQQMGIKAPQLIKKLVAEGVMANMNTPLDFDTVSLVVPEFGFEAQNVEKSVDDMVGSLAFGDLSAELVSRPPVVTVMGHVDHGKTSLLDAIRKANVAAKEAGGITQHIGAYSVNLSDGAKVTFLDTPGHEAFTAMRARGANVTDVAIVVVAADDGVMPQTVEALNHAKAAGVPIIIAVNKIDRPNANVDRIKQQLTEHEIVPEEWGGNTIFCEVSAINNQGITELLEQIHLVAEILELRANPARSATGLVIESRMEKGRGAVATLLVKDGTLKQGNSLVVGSVAGKVRGMSNDQGQMVKEAFPGDPVEIIGLPETPAAGDPFDVTENEALAQEVAEKRRLSKVADETPSSKMSLDQLFAKVKSGDVKELPLVVKGDVAGSLEAIKGSIDKIETEEVKVKIVHSAVGGITESDVLLASTAKGLIIGFNVRPDSGAQKLASERGIEIKCYSVIYELLDELKLAMTGLLDPDIVEKSQGHAEVRETFSVPKLGTIAGCSVTDGSVHRNHEVRLLRDGKIVYTGKLVSLRRFKDDVREVQSGYECGIGIENFNDIKVGDVIETFTREEVAREL